MRWLLVTAVGVLLAACAANEMPLRTDLVQDAASAIQRSKEQCDKDGRDWEKFGWQAELKSGTWEVWLGSRGCPESGATIRAADGYAMCTVCVS